VQSSGPQLEFLVDRGLGRYAVPGAIRARGYVVHTLSSVYGAREQDLDDAEWLRDAGTAGWVVLTKDQRIRRRPLEIAAVAVSGVRAFVLAKGQLRATDQAAYFLNNMSQIVEACRRPGPLIYAVHEHRIRLLWPQAPRSAS
jgi:PIN domain-containing protein